MTTHTTYRPLYPEGYPLRRPDRQLRIALLSIGLLLCSIVLSLPSPQGITTAGFPFVSEPMPLQSSRHVKVLWNIPLSHERMFSSPGFQELTENRHVWVSLQVVECEGHEGTVCCFLFRGQKDAQEAINQIQDLHRIPGDASIRRFGSYVVFARTGSTQEDTTPFYETLFSTIEDHLSNPAEW